MIKRILQILIVMTPFVIFGRLLWLDITPGGQREIRVEVDQVSPFVDRLLPDDRVLGLQTDSTGLSFETIIDEPIYFSIHQSATDFETLEVGLEYRTDAPILEIGPLVDVYAQAYDLKPLHNSLIDESTWTKVNQGSLVLLSRNNDVTNLDDWLADLPPRSKIATYHYDLVTPYRIPDYRSLESSRTFNVSLRGYHKYQTYIKNEPFHLEATLWDMNRTQGADEGMIRVINENGEVMIERPFEDDGDVREDQSPSHQTITIDDLAWPEGVYSVELKGTSDIFWRQITTTQRYLTFVNKIYFGDEVGYLDAPRPVSFYTNAKRLTLETYHADAAQRVQIGSQTILIPQSHEKIKRTITDRGVVRGDAPQGDVFVAGDGKFALSADSFFDPDPVKLGPLTDLDALGIDYIIADYQSPVQENDWQTSSATFDLAPLRQPDGAITFAISVPEIAELQNTVEVQAVTLRFKKAPLSWSGIWSALLDRLPFGL